MELRGWNASKQNLRYHLEARVMRGIDTMEKKREITMGDWLNGEEITTAVALSYVDFLSPRSVENCSKTRDLV